MTNPAYEIARCANLMKDPDAVFVFASNRNGVHGKGSALAAKNLYGAKRGVGEGRSGRCYAIPTKNTWRDNGRPLREIEDTVSRFLDYALAHPELMFVVTRVGTGNAGYREADIIPFFMYAPENCELPPGWRTSIAST